ncbi:DUF7351 domain-containing protein [Halocatena marina]|uniref:ArsR family transcriptional regulator n=1 Tax=Halocatena marina TaxID=2934937 RepID=A0ABD5YXY4_9EURY|nr:hypothetical protein [Halocatena marina]
MDDSSEIGDILAAIGNERRIAILYELQQAYRHDESSLPYATLKRRVGIRDSGNFNYHLQQLVGRFVFEADDGYALTYAGRKIVSALSAGIFTERAGKRRLDAPGTCYACGEAALVARYEQERLYITCQACGEEVFHAPFPPAPVAQRDDRLHAFEVWSRRWNALAATGTCPECGSEMNTTLTTQTPMTSIGNVSHRFLYTCTNCWARVYLPVGCAVRDHPSVIGFHASHNAELDTQPLWNLSWALSCEYTTFDSDHSCVHLRIPIETDELHLSVDDGGTIVSVAGVG